VARLLDEVEKLLGQGSISLGPSCVVVVGHLVVGGR
jgi:hypothetical protein